MVFSSIIFLCAFLPIVCIGYFLLPKRLRNMWLLLLSLLFYAYGEPVYICIMVFSTVFDYTNGRIIDYCKKHGKKWDKYILVLSVVGNLGMLGYFKYTDFLLSTLNQLLGSQFSLLSLALPIGISFYTFQTMSYTIDVYLGKVQCQKNFVDFSMYVCLFPQLIAGPIVKYSCVEKQLQNRSVTIANVANGFSRFTIGLGKKVLLANQAGALYEQMKSLTDGDWSMSVAWLAAISYMFQIYFDFSGYSDMAIGLGKMFGFTFPENFYYPYEAKSITEFWRRWHMTLSGWFREYVYIPLGGNKKGWKRQIINLFIVWFLTGLWHGAGWNFVVWGMYYFLFLVLEKGIWQIFKKKQNQDKRCGKKKNSLAALWKHTYTLLVVLFGWVLFSCEKTEQLLSMLKAMVGNGVKISSPIGVYSWTNTILFFILLAIGATSLPKKIADHVVPTVWKEPLYYLYSCFLLVVSIAFLVRGSYNPFLYFRF